jgi:hypothetical protein
MQFEEKAYDKTIATFDNKGSYTLKLVARINSPTNVQYYVVTEDDTGANAVGYMASLEQFKEIGFMLMSFSKFAEEKIDVSDANEATMDVIFNGLTRKTVISYAIRHKIATEFRRMVLHFKKKYDLD